MKKLGVIGGLGPIATVYFLQLITQMTDAEVDQAHIEILMHSIPATPDRTGYILDHTKENPMPAMCRVGKELADMGAEILAIPCITAHFFHDQMQEEIPVPLLHGIQETVEYLKARGIAKVGIMATDGTVSSGLFQTELQKKGMEAVVPNKEGQKGVMTLIYGQVKAGKPVDIALFQRISKELFAQGAQVILLGCTELSLIKRDEEIGAGFLDVMEVLARKSVMECGRLKKEYEELITR